MSIAATRDMCYFPASSLPPRREALRLAQEADPCVRWLRVQGFDVLHITRGLHGKVRITIRTCPLCDPLEGAVWMFERLGNTEYRYWVAMRFGCEVRWVQGGAA
jgi:hypothetical protein